MVGHAGGAGQRALRDRGAMGQGSSLGNAKAGRAGHREGLWLPGLGAPSQSHPAHTGCCPLGSGVCAWPSVLPCGCPWEQMHVPSNLLPPPPREEGGLALATGVLGP